MKTVSKIGSINAEHIACIFDVNGNQIGTCMDTPNNIAYAFLINDNVHTVSTPYNGKYKRADVEGRFHGLDAAYHVKYIKFN